jgi:hypothetical protein
MSEGLDRAPRVKKLQDQPESFKPAPVPKHLQETAWKPGQSGNPRGRPLGARQKVSEALIADIADVWATYGRNVLVRLAAQDPAALAKIAYGLLPKDIFISVEQRAPGNLEPEAWATLRRILDIIQASAPAGTDPAEIFQTIEDALRAKHATMIEG